MSDESIAAVFPLSRALDGHYSLADKFEIYDNSGERKSAYALPLGELGQITMKTSPCRYILSSSGILLKIHRSESLICIPLMHSWMQERSLKSKTMALQKHQASRS
jgi:hypothetical protein